MEARNTCLNRGTTELPKDCLGGSSCPLDYGSSLSFLSFGYRQGATLMGPLTRSSTPTPRLQASEDEGGCDNSYVQVASKRQECWAVKKCNIPALLHHPSPTPSPTPVTLLWGLRGRFYHVWPQIQCYLFQIVWGVQLLACEGPKPNFPAVKGLATIQLLGWLNSSKNLHKLQ